MPDTLDMHLLRQEYFAVVHTGDGDGWDMNRPAMGSIVMFKSCVCRCPIPGLLGKRKSRKRRR